MPNLEVAHGDCLDVMELLPDSSVDSIVSDPPYGLSFMGRDWDHGVPGVVFWKEALRVAKPGAYLLAFGGSRTYHRLACAIEDAGWEIRDCLSWLYGSGFPKSLDVSKALDKAAGMEREVVGTKIGLPGYSLAPDKGRGTYSPEGRDSEVECSVTEPATDLARQWQGWGTALKPAWEPIILARKPLVGTVAQNVTEHGTGGLNIDGCRIEATDGYAENAVTQGINTARTSYAPAGARRTFEPSNAGRWPANVVLDEEAAALLDRQSGIQKSGTAVGGKGNAASIYGSELTKHRADNQGYGDTGGASRFFYCAKASRKEREAGLEGATVARRSTSYGSLRSRECNVCGTRAKEQGPGARWPNCEHNDWRWVEQESEGTKGGNARNHHPTVKPIALMRWLVKLVTPPGGLVLDPFTGSGTTGCAAALEGFRFLGIEREAEYVEIARRRLEYWAAKA